MRAIQLFAIGALVVVASHRVLAQGEIQVPTQQPTIQQALLAAGPGTTIRVAPGVYAENLFWPTVDGIRLVSDAGASATTIDGGQRARVVNFPTGLTAATVLEGFTITNGLDRDGAGIRVLSSPTIRHNVIEGNDARASTQNEGGGIHVSQGSPRIEFNVIRDNETVGGLNGFGAGVFIRAGANPRLVGNRIVDNTAFGFAFAGGGGVYVGGSPATGATLVSNVIAANAAASTATAEGGGIAVVGGPVAIEHCTIADNVVGGPTSRGGGVFFAASAASGSRVQNSIVARSVAGGGIVVDGGAPTIDDNDVWNNVGGDYVGASAGPNDVSVDPMFVGAADYHLAVGSPLVDAGRNTPTANAEPRDFDGDMRRLDGDLDGRPTRVDIGADEVAHARLSTARSAFLGGAFPLFVSGPLGSSYAIGLSLRSGGLLVEPFGPLLIAFPFAVVSQGTVPGGVTLPVPLAPSLLGQSVHAQAVVYATAGGLRGNATNAEVVPLRAAGPAVVESFVDQSQLDVGASTARWAGTQPGLAAIFGYGGDGSDGDLMVTGASMLDSNTRTPGADGVVVFNFRDLVVQSGGTLTLVGPYPIRLNVERTCRIDGTIQASGQNGMNAPPGTAIAVGPLSGGAGGPGGGAGGPSNTKPNSIPLGALPTDLRGSPGWPRATRDCNEVNRSENFPLIVFQINCGGGVGGNRGVPSGTILRDGCSGSGGGHATPGEQTDFLCSNPGAFGTAFGDQFVIPGGPNEVQAPSAGTGGGAGGNAAITATPNPAPTNDIVAGSGGGAGGGLEVSALGILDVTSTARLLATGGNGGLGHSMLVGPVTVRAGYGGGGAGGSIWLSGTDVRIASGAVIDVRGGTGNPAPPVVNRGGNGGNGYVIARDAGGTPQVAGTITPPVVGGRVGFSPPSTSVAVSKFYDGLSASPNWTFDSSNPQTGLVVPGNDLVFAAPPAPGQTVRIAFQGAPAVGGQPDPNPANWFPQNGFTTDISQINGRRNLRYIRFKIDFDLGPVQKGAPLPNRVIVRQLRIGI